MAKSGELGKEEKGVGVDGRPKGSVGILDILYLYC